jgi:hypothetical protein
LIARLSELRKSSLALKYGPQETVFASDTSGLYIFKRSFENETVLVGLNNSPEKWVGNLATGDTFAEIDDWHGSCSSRWDSKSETLKNIELDSYDYFICILK